MIKADLNSVKNLLNEFEVSIKSPKNKSYFVSTYEIENVLYRLNKKYQLNPVILEELNYYRSLLDFHYRLNIPITAVAKVHNHIEKISWRLVQLTEKKIFDSMRSCDYTEEQINKIKKYVTNKD